MAGSSVSATFGITLQWYTVMAGSTASTTFGMTLKRCYSYGQLLG